MHLTYYASFRLCNRFNTANSWFTTATAAAGFCLKNGHY